MTNDQTNQTQDQTELTQDEVDDLLESMLSRFDPQELEALTRALDLLDADMEDGE